MAKNTPLENHFLVVAYQSLGKNIKKDTWEGPKSIELVEKTAHRLGTFFELPNRFHLIQCGILIKPWKMKKFNWFESAAI